MNYFNSKNKYVNKAIASALIAGSLATGGAVLSTSSASAAARVTVAIPDPSLKKILDSLVTKGTITGAQETAILAAVKAAAPAKGIVMPPKPKVRGLGVMKREDFGHDAARLAVITSTLNQTLPQIQTQLLTGKSLADVAAGSTQALITALVAYDTTKINAQVTANKITPAAAAKLIAGLTARVTAEVNAKGYHIDADGPDGHKLGLSNTPLGAPGTTPAH
jgi:hypothetical protein